MTDIQTIPASHTWQSGDWKEKPFSQAPYNGIQITGVPQYSDNGTFISASITITDYTNNPTGVSSHIQALTTAQGQVDIPAPDTQSDSDSTDADNAATVSGQNTEPDTSATTDSVPASEDNNSDPDNNPNIKTDINSEENDDFTVNGWMALESSSMDIFLRVHFRYGLESFQKEELGYIMGFSAVLKSGN